MAVIRAQVVFPFFTNLPTDVSTNTLHFAELVPQSLADAAADLNPVLRNFYTAVYGTTYMSNYVQTGLAHVNYYSLDQPPPRVPVTLPLFAAPLSTQTSDVPTETAAVLSFQGDRLPGEAQARRRGRIYVGCLSSQAIVDSTTSAFPTLNGLFIGGLRTAADSMRGQAVTAGFNWVVWSPTDQQAVLVTNGWVDNSPDTQRRRSVEATTRTLFPV